MNLKLIMEEKNMTQSELSRLTGITQSSLSDYILSKYEPKQDKVNIIAKALNISPSFLIGTYVPGEEVVIYYDENFKISSANRRFKNNASKFIREYLLSMTEPMKIEKEDQEIPSRQEMIDYISTFRIASSTGNTQYEKLPDDQLLEIYEDLKKLGGEDEEY